MGDGTTGVPIANGTLASFECRLERIVDHTTHIILIGQVVATVLGDGHSLVYLDGGFSSVLLRPEAPRQHDQHSK